MNQNRSAVFNTIQVSRPRRNQFNLSNYHKTTLNMGKLIPTYCEELLPGDSVSIRQENVIRFAPMIAPLMHQVKIKTYWFAVPLRILWSNFERFYSPQDEADRDLIWPHAFVTDNTMGSLAHYLGIPAGTINMNLSVFPIAAYYLIYDEWFRNQNLQDEQSLPVGDGAQPGNYEAKFTDEPLNSNWELDYFTSALPWTQKGPVITVPLIQDGSDPIVGLSGNNLPSIVRQAATGTVAATNQDLQSVAGNVTATVQGSAFFDPNGTLSLNNLQADAATIRVLREAFKLQEFQERDGFGGTRFIETIKNHWDVKSSDGRLNRPEPIGMFSNNISFSEVLQTSETATSPQGNMAGHGIGVNGSGYMRYYAEEPSLLISLSTVKPDTAYYQGISRKWTRETRLDYPWPTFQNIGEQAILNKEINFEDPNPDDEFGYTQRYAEFKYVNNQTSGEFTTNLIYWTLTRSFDTAGQPPVLNDEFVECKMDDFEDRIFTVAGAYAHNLRAYFAHSVYVSRKLSFYGNPSM